MAYYILCNMKCIHYMYTYYAYILYFKGILPMLDPPRRDSACTIANLLNAGIEVKMITGDHLNIAKETAR